LFSGPQIVKLRSCAKPISASHLIGQRGHPIFPS
jgi:hypothetical protein